MILGYIVSYILCMSVNYIGYKKVFETLGIACKCCDVSGNECSSTWTEPCSKLQCLPWKYNIRDTTVLAS